MKRSVGIFLLTLFLFISPTLMKGEIVEVGKGTLKGVLISIQSDCETLKITGEISEDDQQYFRLVPGSVSTLDISLLKFDSRRLLPFALFKTGVKEVLLPLDLKEIGEYCFAESAVESIVLPSSITELGEGVFFNCRNLRNVECGSTALTSICNNTFKGCVSLEKISLPATVCKVGTQAFMGVKLKILSLPNVRSIGSFAFADMSELEEIILPADAKIGEGLFFGDSHLIKVPLNFEYSPSLVMACTGISERDLEIGGEVIGDGAFAGVKIRNLVLSERVIKIGKNAFRNLRSLESVDVSALGTRIPETSEDAFAGVATGTVDLITAAGTSDIWRDDPVWGGFNIQVSGINPLKSNEDVSLNYNFNGGNLTLICNHRMERVRVFDMAGITVYDSYPDTNLLTIKLGNENSIYILETKVGNKQLIKKIFNGKE